METNKPTPEVEPAAQAETHSANGQPGFHVVGIGASAGGLEALERLFRQMPVDTGMAFVVVQHLSPDFRSLTDELLARRTSIPIHRVENGMEVRPDAIYLIPPKKDMILSSGRLLLKLWKNHRNLHHVGAFSCLDDKITAVVELLDDLIDKPDR